MRDWTAGELKSMADRLRRARISAGFERASDATRRFGWSYSRYMNYENGERSIPPKQAILFASAYRITVDYIYFGKTDFSNENEGAHGLTSQMVRRVPLLALENMPELKRIASGEDPAFSVTVPISSRETVPERCIFIEINDKSMSHPRESISFEPGDKALIDLEATPSPSDFVLAIVPEEKTALFRLYREVEREKDGSIVADLVPLNPNFRTVRISTATPGQIVGVCCSIHRVFDLAMGKRSRLG
jgi:transcriptional regulator with XRE-family HTH domain